jgi:DNA-binding NarL/FixJ family response regulator
MSRTVRVIIADKDTEFCNNLQLYLSRHDNINIIDVVQDGQGVVNACQEHLPDVVLMDLHLPVLDSIRAIQTILAQNEYIKILGMSSLANDRYAVEAIKAGACGFIEKNGEITYNTVITAIQQVVNGEVLLSPGLASSILSEFHRLAK